MARLTDYEIEEQFKEYLDDCYPPVKFGDMEYLPSYALKELDPIAYDVWLWDYQSNTECPDCDDVLADCACPDEEVA
jgi:hypothetical protein